MRPILFATAIGFTLLSHTGTCADTLPTQAGIQNNVTLMGTLAEWKYPGSELPLGATMGDGGDPSLQSVKLQAILTTADPIAKVVEFYEKKVNSSTAAHSASVQDDSDDRPLKLRIISVNTSTSSTTLVLSQADGEKVTHIAWSHYLRLGTK